MAARGATKSPLEAARRDCRPEQAEVKMNRSSRPLVSRRNAKYATPNSGGEPIENAVADREPVEGISHEVAYMAKLRYAANRPSSRPKNTI